MLHAYKTTLSQLNHLTEVGKASELPSVGKLPQDITESEQFSQILMAIMNGKYSWACVLLLYWANYKPQNYIPYRTYKRLVKLNRLLKE